MMFQVLDKVFLTVEHQQHQIINLFWGDMYITVANVLLEDFRPPESAPDFKISLDGEDWRTPPLSTGMLKYSTSISFTDRKTPGSVWHKDRCFCFEFIRCPIETSRHLSNNWLDGILVCCGEKPEKSARGRVCLNCNEVWQKPKKQRTSTVPLECKRCGEKGAERYRQRTSYVNEEDNWVTLCSDCREENDEYWDERWEEYYAGIMI